jgi:hypothetical protein
MSRTPRGVLVVPVTAQAWLVHFPDGTSIATTPARLVQTITLGLAELDQDPATPLPPDHDPVVKRAP